MNAYLLSLCYGTFVLLLVAAAVADTVSFTIPNAIPAALILLFPVAAAFSPGPADWTGRLGAAALVFVAGLLAFRLKLFGGGDVKLWSAAALWAGLDLLVAQVILTAALGGLLALLLLIARESAGRVAKLKGSPEHAPSCPRILTAGAPVPYGIAIALSSILLSQRPGFLP